MGREFFCLCFRGLQKARENMAFSRAALTAQAVYCLLAAVYFLWPFPEPPRRRSLPPLPPASLAAIPCNASSRIASLLNHKTWERGPGGEGQTRKHGLFQSRPDGAGSLLSTCCCPLAAVCFLWPFPESSRRRPFPKNPPKARLTCTTAWCEAGVRVRAASPLKGLIEKPADHQSQNDHNHQAQPTP